MKDYVIILYHTINDLYYSSSRSAYKLAKRKENLSYK